jgi:heme/copper-type cytochrome/quinol oxidase subunit 2
MIKFAVALSVALTGIASAAFATEPTVVLTLKNHRYEPAAINVPAGRRIHVHLINQDGAMEEFDSSDLRVEEDVTPHGAADFTVGPLKPGTYAFMGEAHPATALGRFTAVAAER